LDLISLEGTPALLFDTKSFGSALLIFRRLTLTGLVFRAVTRLLGPALLFPPFLFLVGLSI
jgi:hypothetical protein